MNLDNIYKQLEDNLPLPSTKYTIQRILILKEIFEKYPNIKIKHSSNIDFDEYLNLEINSHIVFTQNKDQTNSLNNETDSLFKELKKNNIFFKKYLLFTKYNTTNNGSNPEDFNKILFELNTFNYHCAEINKNNYKTFIKNELSQIVEESNCPQKNNYKKFLDFLIFDGKEYEPKKINFFGKIEIPEIPITLADSLSHSYEMSGYRGYNIYKEEYLLNNITDFIIDNLSSLYDKYNISEIKDFSLVINTNKNELSFNFFNKEKDTLKYNFQYESSLFNYPKLEEQKQDIINTTAIVNYDSLFFIINKIKEEDAFDDREDDINEMLKNIQISLEKLILEKNIIKDKDNNNNNKIKRI